MRRLPRIVVLQEAGEENFQHSFLEDMRRLPWLVVLQAAEEENDQRSMLEVEVLRGHHALAISIEGGGLWQCLHDLYLVMGLAEAVGSKEQIEKLGSVEDLTEAGGGTLRLSDDKKHTGQLGAVEVEEHDCNLEAPAEGARSVQILGGMIAVHLVPFLVAEERGNTAEGLHNGRGKARLVQPIGLLKIHEGMAPLRRRLGSMPSLQIEYATVLSYEI